MRDWNPVRRRAEFRRSWVCILPMRDWNSELQLAQLEVDQIVCILPMRDWNCSRKGSRKSKEKVCILPMRDWNFLQSLIFRLLLPSLYLTYEGLKHRRFRYYPRILFRVCILPMRDWNDETINWWIAEHDGLYLTYEGLKPKRNIVQRRQHLRLYLTYEGLKLGRLPHFFWNDGRLYLTYEGLKLSNTPKPWSIGIRVCILPMRDWNLIRSKCRTMRTEKVCILPMRDWNNYRLELTNLLKCVFVSYLWGIET